MAISESDPVAYKILQSIPKDLTTAQYSTKEQLEVLYEFAVRLKLEDAANVLRRQLRPFS